MATITTRVQGASPKGSPLTNAEVDDNFINLNTAKYESGDNVTLGTGTFDNLKMNGTNPYLTLERTGTPTWQIRNNYHATNYGLSIFDATNGVQRFAANLGEVVANEDSVDQDFRVESDTSTHALFVDAGNNVVGLGTASTLDSWTGYTPTALGNMLMIGSTGASSTFTNMVHGGYYDGTNWLQRFTDVTVARHEMIGGASGSTHNFYTATNVTVDTAPTLVKNLKLVPTAAIFNEDSADIDFRVESDTNTHALFVDAGNSRVGINTDAPFSGYDLTVKGLINQNGVAVKGIIRPYLSYVSSRTVGTGAQWFKIWDSGADPSPYNLHFKINTGGDNTVFSGEFSVCVAGYGFAHSITMLSNQYYNYPKLLEIRTVNPSSGANAQVWINLASITASAGHLYVYCDDGRATVGELTAGAEPATNSNGAVMYVTAWSSNRNHSLAVSKGGVGHMTGAIARFWNSNDTRSSSIYHDTGGMQIRTNNTGDIISVASNSRIELQAGDGTELVVNQSSSDADFRVESDADTHALFVDAGNDRVGMRVSAPISTLHLSTQGTGGGIVVDNTYTGGGGGTSGLSGAGAKNNLLELRAAYADNPATSQNAGMKWGIKFTGYTGSTLALNNKGAGIYAVSEDYEAGYNRTVGLAFEVSEFDAAPTERLRMYNDGWLVSTVNNSRMARFRSSGSNANDKKLDIRSGGDRVIVEASWASDVYGTILDFRLGQDSDTSSLALGSAAVFNENSADIDFRVESDGNANMLFVDAGSNVVCIGHNGGVYSMGSGTQTGTFLRGDGYIGHTTSENNAALILRKLNYGGTMIRFYKETGIVGDIVVSDTGTIYNTASDRRLKENIEPITDGTAKLLAMNPVTHTWIADPDAPAVHGFIAQEMQSVVPESVSGTPDGEGMMSMDYGRITPVIVAALQDALREIDSLKQRIAALEGK